MRRIIQNSKNPVISIILIVLIIAGFSILRFLRTENTTPNSDNTNKITTSVSNTNPKTETYIDRNYPFSFEYPGGWFLKIQDDGSGIVYADKNPIYDIQISDKELFVQNGEKAECTFAITLYDYPERLDIEKWYQQTMDDYYQDIKGKDLSPEEFVVSLPDRYNIIDLNGTPALAFKSLSIGGRLVAYDDKLYRLQPALEPLFDDFCKDNNQLIMNSFTIKK